MIFDKGTVLRFHLGDNNTQEGVVDVDHGQSVVLDGEEFAKNALHILEVIAPNGEGTAEDQEGAGDDGSAADTAAVQEDPAAGVHPTVALAMEDLHQRLLKAEEKVEWLLTELGLRPGAPQPQERQGQTSVAKARKAQKQQQQQKPDDNGAEQQLRPTEDTSAGAGSKGPGADGLPGDPASEGAK